MPIKHERGILYSCLELSQTTNIPLEKINRFIEEKNFTRIIKIDSIYYIDKNDLSLFFDEFFSYLHILPPYYEVPEDLRNNSSPWAMTLVNMYQEKFVYGTSLSPSQGRFLKDLVCNINPQNILEIGCFIGISTLWMASGLEQIGNTAIIHSVDLFYEIMPCFPYRWGYLKDPFEFVQKSACSAQVAHRIKFYKMDSYEIGKDFREIINEPIDLLFIDGDHSIRGCMNDFALLSPHVVPGGYVILHDIYPEHSGYKGPRYVIDHVIKNSPYFNLVEIKTYPHNFGMALVQKLEGKKKFFPGVDLRLDMIRVKAYLQNTSIWKKVKNTPIGNSLKKFLHNFIRWL